MDNCDTINQLVVQYRKVKSVKPNVEEEMISQIAGRNYDKLTLVGKIEVGYTCILYIILYYTILLLNTSIFNCTSAHTSLSLISHISSLICHFRYSIRY